MSAPAVARPAHLAGAVYGQIVSTSTTVALGLGSDAGTGTLLLSVVATMLVLWVAHAFSAFVETQVAGGRLLGLRGLGRSLAADWPLVQAAGPAVLALALALLGVWSRDTAVTVAFALGILSLAGWGLLIGRRSGASWPLSAGIATVTAALGGVVYLLELLMH